MKAQKGSISAPNGGEWLTPSPSLFTPGERQGSHCTGGWVGPGPVWTSAETLAPSEFDPRTVMPVAVDIQAHNFKLVDFINCNLNSIDIVKSIILKE